MNTIATFKAKAATWSMTTVGVMVIGAGKCDTAPLGFSRS